MTVENSPVSMIKAVQECLDKALAAYAAVCYLRHKGHVVLVRYLVLGDVGFRMCFKPSYLIVERGEDLFAVSNQLLCT